jgi:recombination protein RecR
MAHLQGVGPRTAQRYALNMLKWTATEQQNLAHAIEQISSLKYCSQCHAFQDNDCCLLCSNPRRAETKILCVVEQYQDLMAVEKSGKFKGLYHLLGGVLNPLMGIGPEQLKVQSLIERIKEQEIQEVILALNPSMEGDATCSYLAYLMQSLSIKVHRLGLGIPVGGSLEYLDSQTIFSALENKRLV